MSEKCVAGLSTVQILIKRYIIIPLICILDELVPFIDFPVNCVCHGVFMYSVENKWGINAHTHIWRNEHARSTSNETLQKPLVVHEVFDNYNQDWALLRPTSHDIMLLCFACIAW